VEKRWIWIGIGAVVALGALGVAVAAPVAQRMVVARARERGVHLTLGRVDVGLTRLELRGLRMTLEGVPNLEVRLAEVDLGVRLWGLGLASVHGRGGQVETSGDWTELRERLEAWRARHRGKRRGSDDTARAGAVELTLSRVGVHLHLGEGEELRVTGLALEDLGPGPARLGADRMTFIRPGLGIDAAGFEVSFQHEPQGFSLPSARMAEARVSLRLEGADETKAVQGDSPAPSPKAIATPSPADGPARGLAERWVAHPERVAGARALLELIRSEVRGKLPPEVTVDRLWLGVESGAERLAIGPSRLTLTKSNAVFGWSLLPLERAHGTPLELSGQVPLSEGQPVSVRLRGGPVTFGQLGIKEGDFGLAAVLGSTLEGQADVELAADASTWTASGSLALENLAVRAERLAHETILVPRLSTRGVLRVQVDGSGFSLEDAELAIGQARFDGRLQIAGKEGRVLLDAGLRAPLVSCQALLDSAPRALLGTVADMQWSGTFSLDAAVHADSMALAKMGVAWKFDSGCRITAVPVDLDPERFRRPFSLDVVAAGGALETREFGPGSAQFVPIDEISPYMEAALLVTEDGRFHKHRGFDDRAIESALADNVRAGRFVRGASTLTMQLAKNLFLSRTKTLSRKLQEAALTVLLEQSFSKREILEIYLNVVEFGPGVYGVGPAASYYFAKTPRELSPAQAFFLASLLPAPTVQHFDAEGRLSASRWRHVQSLLRISQERGRLSEEELQRASSEVLRFGVSDSQPGADPEAPPP
jgi:hypothetical protein